MWLADIVLGVKLPTFFVYKCVRAILTPLQVTAILRQHFSAMDGRRDVGKRCLHMLYVIEF